MPHNVLFVSKAVAPPFRDGASCWVRDLVPAMTRVRPAVLSTTDAPTLAAHVEMERIYRRRSRYAPALVDNIRVLAHLLMDGRHDVWHFVFAPNPASSQAAKLARGVRRKPTVQTVASRPLHFEGSDRLLFGDRIVALSRHTADELIAHGAPAAKLVVVPPPVADIERDDAARRAARERAGIARGAPLYVYAGDLEFSSGAQQMANAAPAIVRAVPESVIAFACRAKTPRAQEHQARLAEQLEPLGQSVRFLGEIEDLPALIASAVAAPFPVDDLYGKVDLPYVVLEAALLKVPILVTQGGPLTEIEEAPAIAPADTEALSGWCIEMAQDERARRQLGENLRRGIVARHAPSVVADQVQALYDEICRT